jgi:hypothetical protein
MTKRKDKLVAKHDEDYTSRVDPATRPMDVQDLAIVDFNTLPVIAKVSAHSFICSSFIKSIRENEWYKDIDEEVFFESANALINNYIDTYNIKLLVDEKNLEYFYGWFMFKEIADDIIEVVYVYIKHLFRRKKLASILIKKYCCGKKQIRYRYRTNPIIKALSVPQEGMEIYKKRLKWVGF